MIASEDEQLALDLQAAITSITFRVYVNDDLVGVELCAAAKNVIALAAGGADGLELGDNAKAALVARGLAEMARLAEGAGGKQGTFAGLAGMGDLVVTCWSKSGRNRRAGELIAQGTDPDDAVRQIGMVVEGLTTAPVLRDLSHRLGIELPITEGVCAVLDGEPLHDLVGTSDAAEADHRVGTLSPMAARSFSFTSESVTEGHPDKIADQVSDAVLDAVLTDDPNGRVACETLITTGLVVVAGEITTETYVDIPRLVRKTIADIGYTRAKYGFDAETCGVVVAIDEQSPDIAQGVDDSFEAQHGDSDPLDRVGAGDQGMMFGYASNETDELMPLPIQLAHRICKRLSEVRKADVLPYLRPDGKAQVTVRYEVDEHGHQRPVEIERILVSTQHRDGLDSETLIKPDLIEHVLHPILPHSLYDAKRLEEKDFVYVNPTGKFVIGGPMGDTGLTGRKIIVDTYGGAAPHGGGAFSGKDPTKVDRSAAYAARYVAKNVVAAGIAERCQIQVAYAIGVAHPLSVLVDTFGTEAEGLTQDRIEQLVREHFDLRPAAILRDLDLRRPIYEKTAAYGHFGREDRDFTWERTDKADALRQAAGLGNARNRLAASPVQ